MKMKVKGKLITLAEKIHLKVFGHSMGSEMKKFLGNLSWSFFAGIFVMPLIMLTTTMAGHYMGPMEYGKYSLLLVINQFLVIIIFFGLDTSTVKYIAKAKNHEQKKKVISASVAFLYLMLGLLILITLIAIPIISKYSGDNLMFVVLLTLYTVAVCSKVMLDTIVRGLEEFKKQTLGKVIEAGTVVGFFVLFFILLRKYNFSNLVITLSAGAIMISLYFFSLIKKYLGKTEQKFLLTQLRESKLFFINAVLGTLFISADRLIVGRYLGIKTLGIYSAYYMSSIIIVSQISQLVTNVFLSATSRLEDKSFAKKIDKSLALGFVPMMCLMAIILLIMLQIFGREYPKNLVYILGFSLLSSLYFFQALYDTVIIDSPKEDYAKYLIARNGINALAVLIYIVGTHFRCISISFILLTLVADYTLLIFIQRLFIKGMQDKKRLPLPILCDTV